MEQYLIKILLFLITFQLYSCVDQEGNDLTKEYLSTIQSSIIDGQYDEGNNLKNVVFLRTQSSICSATVIHPYLVLTAAHCVDESNVSGVILSNKIEMNSTNTTVLIPVAKVIINPAYKEFETIRKQEERES